MSSNKSTNGDRHRVSGSASSRKTRSSKQPSDPLKQLLAESVKASGFPFQAKIQDLIESSSKWEVLTTECPWRYEGREEFLDIVACHNNIHLVNRMQKIRDSQIYTNEIWSRMVCGRSQAFFRLSLSQQRRRDP